MGNSNKKSVMKDIESKLDNMDTKIANKVRVVNEIYESDLKKIDLNYFNKQERVENSLNEHRESLLLKINEELVKNINDINEIKSFHKELTLNLLTEKFDEIKADFLFLNQKVSIMPHNNWKKYSLSKGFDIFQLNKYSNLIKLKKKCFKFKLDKKYYSFAFINISTNPRFIFISNYGNKMTIWNESGTAFSTKFNSKHFRQGRIRISNKYIFHIYYENEIHNFARRIIVEIYDFDLNLIKLMKLSHEYQLSITITNTEFAFQNNNQFKILAYKYDSFQTEYIRMPKKTGIKSFYLIRLAYMNDKNLYFIGTLNNTLKIVDRFNGNIVKSICFNGRFTINSLKFDLNSNIYVNYNTELVVYNQDGMNIYTIEFKNKIKSLSFDPFGNIFLNKVIYQNAIEFEEF